MIKIQAIHILVPLVPMSSKDVHCIASTNTLERLNIIKYLKKKYM